MEWEDKTKMIKLGNNQDNSDKAKKEFHNCVLSNVPSFDEQAWDMFSNLVELIPEKMKSEIQFWEKLYPYLKALGSNIDNLSFRAIMRIALMQTICEEQLNLK